MIHAQNVYKALLKMYPSKFQKRFSSEMLEVWTELYNEHRVSNSSSTIFWVSTFSDVLVNATKQRIKEGPMDFINKPITKLPIEAIYLSLGVIVAGLMFSPLLIQITGMVDQLIGAPFASIVAIFLIMAFIVPSFLNFRFLVGKDEVMKNKVRRSVLIYGISVCAAFALMFILQGPTFEIIGLIASLSILFLSRPWWGRQWLTVSALGFSCLMLMGTIVMFWTTRFDNILVNDVVIQRVEMALCDRLWPANADGINDQCEVSVQTATDSHKRTYLP